MKRVLTFRSKRNPLGYVRLRLYFYLVRAYSKFLIAGKCLDFPLVIQIQTQSYCNGSCLTCPYPVVRKRLEQGTMQWDLYKKIADKLAAESLLSGIIYELHNEPLLDKRLFNFIKYLKSINNNKTCVLVTNGQLLDKFSLTEIKESDIDMIIVSLNAHSKETYQILNKGLDYDRVMNNIEYLLSDGHIKKGLELSFLITEENLNEIYPAIQYWHKRGVKSRIIGITNRAGTLVGYEKVRPKTKYKGNTLPYRLWRYFISRLGKVTGCHLPFCQMNILFNGDVIICCHDWTRTTVIGNVRDSSLREVWNSPRANEIRRLILKKRYDQIEACKECSLVGRQQ